MNGKEEKLSGLVLAADDAAGLIGRAIEELSAGDRVPVKEVKEIISCIKDLTGVIRSLNGISEEPAEDREIKIIMGLAEQYGD